MGTGTRDSKLQQVCVQHQNISRLYFELLSLNVWKVGRGPSELGLPAGSGKLMNDFILGNDIV